MIININKLAGELKITTPDLIARINGRLIYEKTKKILGNINNGETLIIDFAGIQVIDSSFIDEFIVNLLKDAMTKNPSFYIKLRNVSKSSELNIESVLRTYSTFNNEKMAVGTEDICQNNNFFIGTLSNTERDMIHYLRLNKSGSLSDIAEFSGLDEIMVRNIMEELSALRLVKNDGGGYFSGI